MNKFSQKFSIAHPDLNCKGSMFYDSISRATPEFRSEIADIYFGTYFEYEYNGETKRYGTTMNIGIEPFGEEFYNLLKIQQEYGITISLTINPTQHPHELMFDMDIINKFVEWIGKYYELGVRSCTISNVTMMRYGILQKRFPNMKWKNTVNHKVKTAQEYVDYVSLGYSIIQLDRSLMRNIDELRKIKKVRDKIDIPVYLLVYEDCMPECPMWNEHTSDLSCGNMYETENACGKWNSNMYRIPRVNLDAYWIHQDIYDEYHNLVDVFKYSGRYYHIDEDSVACWLFGDNGIMGVGDEEVEIKKSSFSEVYETGYISWWIPMNITQNIETPQLNLPENVIVDTDLIKNMLSKIDNNRKPSQLPFTVWDTKEGRTLEKKLTQCESQCYDCHLCEYVFGIDEYNSVLDLSTEQIEINDNKVYIKVESIKGK